MWIGLRVSLWDLVLLGSSSPPYLWPNAKNQHRGDGTLWQPIAFYDALMLYCPSLKSDRFLNSCFLSSCPTWIFQQCHIFYHQFPFAVTGNCFQPGWCSKVFEATVKAHDLKNIYRFVARVARLVFCCFLWWRNSCFCMKVGTKRPEHPTYGERSRHGWAKRRLRGRNNSRKRRWTFHLPPHAMSARCPEETSTTRDAISFCAPISLSRK